MCLNPDKEQNIVNYIKLINHTLSLKVNTVLIFNIRHNLILHLLFYTFNKIHMICIQFYLTFVHHAMRFTNTAKVAIYVSSFITLLSPLLSPPFLSFSYSQVKLLFKNPVAILSIRIDSLQQSPFLVKNNLGNGLS